MTLAITPYGVPSNILFPVLNLDQEEAIKRFMESVASIKEVTKIGSKILINLGLESHAVAKAWLVQASSEADYAALLLLNGEKIKSSSSKFQSALLSYGEAFKELDKGMGRGLYEEKLTQDACLGEANTVLNYAYGLRLEKMNATEVHSQLLTRLDSRSPCTKPSASFEHIYRDLRNQVNSFIIPN